MNNTDTPLIRVDVTAVKFHKSFIFAGNCLGYIHLFLLPFLLQNYPF